MQHTGMKMRFFTELDMADAITIMLERIDLDDKVLWGTMNGIKRRARARAIVDFGKQMTPAPPDYSITTMDVLFRRLFSRSISKNTLHLYFATPGRRANDRVDLNDLGDWYSEHGDRLRIEADQLIADLELEWKLFTHEAALRTGKRRREIKQE